TTGARAPCRHSTVKKDGITAYWNAGATSSQGLVVLVLVVLADLVVGRAPTLRVDEFLKLSGVALEREQRARQRLAVLAPVEVVVQAEVAEIITDLLWRFAAMQRKLDELEEMDRPGGVVLRLHAGNPLDADGKAHPLPRRVDRAPAQHPRP